MIYCKSINQTCHVESLKAQRTLDVHPPPFAWSVFSQQLFANVYRIFSRFRWIDLGNCSHDAVYNGKKCDMSV